METSDWGTSLSEGRSSPSRRQTSSFRSNNFRVSPILADRNSPIDAGKSSPDSGDGPHNSTMKDDVIHDKQAELISDYQKEIRQLNRKVQDLQMNKTITDDNEANDLRRKLASFEEEQAEKTRAFNEETTKLHSQIAKLRSAVERGETTRQKLEYELALAHKAASHEKRGATERENQLQRSNASLKEQIDELNKKIQTLEKDLANNKQTYRNDEKKYRQLNVDKDKVIFQLQEEIKDQQDGQKRLSHALQEQTNFCNEMQEKCLALEAQRTSQGEAIHKQQKELEFSVEKEDRLKKELEQYQERVKSLEESIEAERTAHLETKFNSEIVQLRVRDLEGALEVEKSAVEEARLNMELLNKQIRELESTYEKERDKCKAQESRIAELEETLGKERRDLSTEIEEKQKIITNLAKQLEVHQKNFDALKAELMQARKRQIKLDTTYGSSMRELELLLENFTVEKPEDDKKSQKKDKTKPPSPAQVLENLRHTMLDYQSRCSNASAELKRHRQVVEKLSSDCEKYKNMVMRKDKTVKELEDHLTKASKELANARTECAERESVIASLKLDLQNKTKTTEEESERIRSFEDENNRLKAAYKNDDELRRSFLHSLYQRMITGKVYVSSPDSSLGKFSWTDMSNMVSEQVSAQMSELHRLTERVDHLEDVVTRKEEALQNSQEAHEQTVAKLSSAIKEREVSWKRQKIELEDHYKKIISDLKNRSKKSQNLADKAWERIQETGQVKETLEQQNNKLLQGMEQVSRENASLLSACALLTGTLWPAYTRIRALTLQRNMLNEYVGSLEGLRRMARNLSDMLNNELEDETTPEGTPPRTRLFSDGRHPLLVFRTAVVAVIAANRLRYLGHVSCKLFVSSACPGEVGGLAVVMAGGRSRERVHFKAVIENLNQTIYDIRKSRDVPGRDNAHAWFTSGDLRDHVTSSLVDLQNCLSRSSGRDQTHQEDDVSMVTSSPSKTTAVINAAKISFSKLVSRLQPEFPAASSEEEMWRDGYGYRGDLVFMLGQGLHKLLASFNLPNGTSYSSSQETIANLQGHILGFTQRLHTAEVERRSLRLELSKACQEASELKNVHTGNQGEVRKARENARSLEEKIQEMKEQMVSMVPVDRFQNVCDELNNALKREQQAQALLNEQTTQMQEIGARLEMHASQGEEKDATLEQAVRGLSEAKMDVRRQEHAVRQMTKQITYLESEKKSLSERVADAEKTLTSAAREKEALLAYLKSVERALEQSIDQVRLSQGTVGLYELSLPQLMTPDERLALDGQSVGPEMLAIQNVVLAFVEAQQKSLDQITSLQAERQQILSRIATMDEELTSHKAHIQSLKRELSAACRRQMSDDGMSDLTSSAKSGTKQNFDDSLSKLDDCWALLNDAKAVENRKITSLVKLQSELQEACRRMSSDEQSSDYPMSSSNITSTDKQIDSESDRKDVFPGKEPAGRRYPEDSFKADFVPLSAHRDSSLSGFRPSFASTSIPSNDDNNKASFSSPKRRLPSRSSHKRENRQHGQEYPRYYDPNHR